MKIAIRSFIACIVCCLLLMSQEKAVAQTKSVASMGKPLSASNYEERSNKATKRMAQQLGLSDDQVRKVNAINLEFYNGVVSITVTDPKERAKEIKKLGEQKESKLRKALTVRQFKKYKDEFRAMQQRTATHRKQLREGKQ